MRGVLLVVGGFFVGVPWLVHGGKQEYTRSAGRGTRSSMPVVPLPAHV
ncbi:hypothetical protein AB5J49_36585 [Streptomyces sp. R28]|uniref:Uncharacterized protein n=1 Tax=Streptomyces sp. R28 TaxID=3238628 RepID=A0AB39QBJ7_9ACTN